MSTFRMKSKTVHYHNQNIEYCYRVTKEDLTNDIKLWHRSYNNFSKQIS